MVGGAAAEPVGGVRDDRVAVAVAGLLSFVAMFDMNVVNVALPRIADGFDADPRSVQWVVLAYAIPAVALLLPAGRWLDRVALRPALLLAVAVFAAANLAAVVAPSLPVLVGLRALQGVGGAVLMVLMPVLAMAAVAPQRRGRAMAVPATAGPVGGVLGPAVGGPLIELAGWRVAFVPAVLVSLAAVVLVRRSRIVAGVLAGPDRAGLVDATLLVAGLGAVCAVATGLLTGPAAVAVAVVAGIAALVAWGARPGARSVAAALRPGGTAPTVAVALLAGAFAAASYLVAVGVQAGGSGPAAAGFVLLAFPLGMVVAGPPAGRLADRFSRARSLSRASPSPRPASRCSPRCPTWGPRPRPTSSGGWPWPGWAPGSTADPPRSSCSPGPRAPGWRRPGPACSAPARSVSLSARPPRRSPGAPRAPAPCSPPAPP
nr:MFS transporter [Pseudonocardia sp. AL041005-10]